MMPLQDRYACTIRHFREKAGVSQGHLARRMHVDPSFLAHLESGRRAPSIETLHKLAGALGVSAAEVVARVEAIR